jgi:hypothetical protein
MLALPSWEDGNMDGKSLRTLAHYPAGSAAPESVCGNFGNGVDNRFAMLCCGKRWFNSLLWNHHAEDHRGLRLGFDVDDRGVKRTLATTLLSGRSFFPAARHSAIGNFSLQDCGRSSPQEGRQYARTAEQVR